MTAQREDNGKSCINPMARACSPGSEPKSMAQSGSLRSTTRNKLSITLNYFVFTEESGRGSNDCPFKQNTWLIALRNINLYQNQPIGLLFQRM